jgi:antimicrobial peptide system SdpB family protein
LLAAGTALTLIFNRNDVLFSQDFQLLPKSLAAAFVTRLNLFAIVPLEWIGLAKWIAVLVLLLVASGWRPRFTAIPHWWISWSFAGACSVPDGGDHVTAALTGLFLPIALTDPRRWHWAVCPVLGLRHPRWHEVRRFLAQSGFAVVRLQVAVIYAHAVTAKLAVTEWVNGTAMYYWLNHPVFGAPLWLREISRPITASSVGVMTLTWSALVIESALFAGLFMVKSWRLYLFVLGVAFHALIVLFHGLPSFSIAMTGALTAYLLTPDGLGTLQRLPDQVSRRVLGNLRAKGAHHVDSSEASCAVSVNSSDNGNYSVPRELQRGDWPQSATE